MRAFGGSWAFPGGRVEPGDGKEGVEATYRTTAVRETAEETNLQFDPEALLPVCSWTTPERMDRRYENWFFAAAATRAQEVHVDGFEMVDAQWLPPREVLARHAEGDLALVVPAFIFASRLTRATSLQGALDEIAAWPWEDLRPRTHVVHGGRLAFYQGDACYDAEPPFDLERAGGRHRLFMLGDGWRYERDLKASVPVSAEDPPAREGSPT